MKSWRRYEILLPRRFNDGRPVPKALLAETLLELENRFGAVSTETQIILGRWRSGGRTFRDDLMRVYVDVEATQEVDAFFATFKGRLKSRFDQLDIWLTSYSIDVL
jgi:hypothetical protein